MRFNVTHLFFIAVTMVTGIACNHSEDPGIQTGGREVITFRALPFSLSQVVLLDGPFRHATELNIKSLLAYEPDRLLARYRTEAGLEAKAEPYHGWEDATISGHSLGHHLSACAQMFSTTGDQRFLDRVNYIVDELETCQDSSGYVGAVPGGKKILEEEVAKGNIHARGFDLNGLWVPWYVHHKVLAGLRDAYRLCGNTKALDIAGKFAAWTARIVAGLTTEQVQLMLSCEHGGMNEVLADLYADTGEKKYLELSRIFHHEAILEPLARSIDILPGKHGNTNIPKLIGLARRYELTADTGDRHAAEFFWQTVVRHHSYVTGGHGNHEYFGPADSLSNRLSDETTETCNVYNMLKLSQHLFSWTASPEVADYCERALFNHILSSQNPVDGRVVYHLSLDMGGKKAFQDPYDFTCCIGTGMENHSRYGGFIYFHNDKELFINQFIASELDWKDKGLVIRQVTRFPDERGTSLELECIQPVLLTLQVRYPSWATEGMVLRVNGRKIKVKQEPGSFVPVKRHWQNNDRIEITFPFSLRLEAMPDNQNRVALMYGPLVLAGDLGQENDMMATVETAVPILMTKERDPRQWTEQVAGQSNTFLTRETGKPADILFSPFYKMYDRRYSIYFDMLTREEWEQRQAEIQRRREEKKKIDESTIDRVIPADMRSERIHRFQGENAGQWELKGRKYREARSGWFSYDMKVQPDQPLALAVEYWGGFPGGKTFDILVNGNIIATENISRKKEGQFVFEVYPIPEEITSDKHTVTVLFRSHEFHTAGPVFDIRIVKQ